MLRSSISVDLPSAVANRGKTVGEWLRGLFGARLNLRGNQEELTISAMSLVTGMVEAFSAAGVTDVISFVIDKKVVYLDTREVDDDLALILDAAEQKGILEKPFKEMHLVLSHKAAGMHVLLDVGIRNRVVIGDEEMVVNLSARIAELQIAAGESPSAYQERIQVFMSRPPDGYRAALDDLTGRVAAALQRSLVGARVRTVPALVQVVRVEGKQVGRFRKLRFGDDVESPRYRAVPTFARGGAYADPFFYYYYDPYYDFMNWVMLDSMLHHQAWASPAVQIVSPAGQPLATGDAVDDAASDWIGRDALSVGSEEITVSPSIATSDDSGGGLFSFGGGSDSGGDSWGGGDSGSSSDSGSSGDSGSSSCSSGGSSSCGSSCGGGSSD